MTRKRKRASASNALAVVDYLYTADRLDAGYVITLSNGATVRRELVRDSSRRALVTGIATSANGLEVESLDYGYDADSRPVARNADRFGYNVRGEVTSATIGGTDSVYGYDEIGNSTNWTANCLNQYTHCAYDADGNMTQYGDWAYTYDSMNRLATASSNGVLLVTNSYDVRSRRVRKVTSEATTTFFYDDWNLVEERVAYTNGISSTIHYYWGNDLSGTFQGAGGVGGLLYLTVDGAVYIPYYDNNGNIMRYLDASGATVAAYTYDAFGKTITQSGPFADLFRHRFSTKYLDDNVALYCYGYRFYSTGLRRWLTRDPISEEGGVNLFTFALNNAISNIDYLGFNIIVIKHLPKEAPPGGWPTINGGKCLALTVYNSPTFDVKEVNKPGGRISFSVDVNPPNSYVDVYFRSLKEYLTKMCFENDHVSVARRHEQAIQDFKRALESICDCPDQARKVKSLEEERLMKKVKALKAENDAYDAPGGKHVLYQH